jgi:hypothetical protein
MQYRTSVNHNKAAGFERRLELYLMENFRHAFDMERFGISISVDIGQSQMPSSYVYYTQIMQAETLAAAYRAWRRNWAGPGREYTAGALVWQVVAIRRTVVSISDLFEDQRLLACDFLVNSRLFPSAEACLFCNRARTPSVYGRDEAQRFQRVCGRTYIGSLYYYVAAGNLGH